MTININEKIEKSDDSSKDPIQKVIQKIKDAKRAKMKIKESQENRDEDNVDVNNDKIEQNKDNYETPQKHIGDSTDEWVYEDSEDPEAKDGEKAAEEVAQTTKDAEPVLTGDDEAAIDDVVKKVNKYTNAAPEADEDSKDDEEKLEEDANRDTDSVSDDNDKIEACKNKDDNPKSLEHASDIEKYVTKEDFDLKEDMDAILGKEVLPESFKSRLETIYTAAVVSKVNEVISEAVKIMKEDLAAYKQKLHENVADKVNDYLNVVVEEWAKENKEALFEQAKYDASQSFMNGLKDLYEQHGWSIPAEKQNVFDKILQENIELEDKYNQVINEKFELVQQLKSVNKDKILNEACKGLSLTQAEKLKLLSESIEFTTDVDYKLHLTEIRDAYFSAKDVKRRSIEEDMTPVVLNEETTTIMDDEVAGAVTFLNKKA